MKKIFTMVLLILSCLLMTGCGDNIPSGIYVCDDALYWTSGGNYDECEAEEERLKKLYSDTEIIIKNSKMTFDKKTYKLISYEPPEEYVNHYIKHYYVKESGADSTNVLTCEEDYAGPVRIEYYLEDDKRYIWVTYSTSGTTESDVYSLHFIKTQK